ncbi:restriction endonuclease [Paenibacillus planticolens]|uniref:Restriction endonuclease type IV Mrr domain-containing protein n=1 Tax=Paenibacillus planticolens TaxID=2654976 RepID=A0ABX1ZGB1_9BACL|nr:restriction endonuclease [Paenibacillus planticolens]NOU99105.1 hypothetical protein [Paenibacillus planticolens]
MITVGQIKCNADNNPVSFDPIAIIHSQMIKQNAKGGYVITTSTFTLNAKVYAEGLNIKLIEGRELIDLWVRSLEHKILHQKSYLTLPLFRINRESDYKSGLPFN